MMLSRLLTLTLLSVTSGFQMGALEFPRGPSFLH